MTRPLDHDPAGWIGRAYDCHAAGLYRYALMLLGDTAGAADVVQQVFVALLRRRGSSDAVEQEAHYLRRAVRNECFSAWRRRRAERTDHPLVEPIESAPANLEERAAVNEALRLLPPEQREVVHLKVYEGMTFQEIADVSGESINTIASRYRYAMDKLRVHFEVKR